LRIILSQSYSYLKPTGGAHSCGHTEQTTNDKSKSFAKDIKLSKKTKDKLIKTYHQLISNAMLRLHLA